jgi:hypothetical protein
VATVSLPENPNLDHLRGQARDLQRAARAGDPAALARIAKHHPAPRGELSALPLHTAQLVLAREYGFPSWPRLRHYLDVVAEHGWTPSAVEPAEPSEGVAARFCRLACLTYTAEDGPRRWAGARELLDAVPGLVDDDVWAAAAASDEAALARHLARDPGLARAAGGPYGWRPLAYLAYSRVGRGEPVAAARALIEAGADPNEGYLWHGLPTPFTLLTGVFGGGEQGQPPHPAVRELARLLLDAGADPNDGQALYNRMFSGDDDHLDLLFAYGLGRGDGGVWRRRLGPEALDSPQQLLRGMLRWAIEHGQLDRVRRLADHVADLDAPVTEPYPTAGRRADARTPMDVALLSGHREVADYLAARGAGPATDDSADLVAAALTGDREAVARLRDAQPATWDAVLRARPGLVVWAAARRWPAAVRLLVEVGFDVNAYGRGDAQVAGERETALHVAAGNGDADLVALLLRLGADPTLRDARFDGTPADWARHFGHDDVAELLA